MKSPIALRIFLVGIIAIFLSVIPTFNKAFASGVIFQDNFDNGSLSNWTTNFNNCLYNNVPAKWMVASGRVGVRINGPSCRIDLVPTDQSWIGIGDNYSVVLDMTLVSGTDHNLGIRYTNPSHYYDFHIQSPTRLILDSDSPMKEDVGDYTNGQTIHFKIIVKGRSLQVYRGNNPESLIIENSAIDINYLTGRIALQGTVGGDSSSETWFDNIVVTSLDDSPTATPTLTPTPTFTPTPTLTPTPTSQQKINVPVLRQTDNPWSSQIYDGANFWSPFAKTIKNWGCALTSYAMVLRYFGINKLPNGIILDPGTLNSWLKANNGYIDGKNSGYVNPLAISSLSKKATKINNITSFDALEYTRISTSDSNILADQINNNHPAVLEEPGHFIVANGIMSNTFNIIDPYYTNRTDLTAYDNTFNSLNELIPSKTDLSYILVTGSTDLNMQIKDSNGNNLGEQFDQQPLINQETGNPSGNPIRIYYFQKPQTGMYKLELGSSKSGIYNVNVYLYDKNGEVNIEEVSVITHVEKTDTVDLKFNSQNSNSSRINKVVTFDSLIDDIKDLNSLNLISDNASKKLVRSVIEIQKHYNKRFKMITGLELELVKKTLLFYDKRQLNHQAYDVISQDIEDLIKGL